mgnify:CR=1 FL=1
MEPETLSVEFTGEWGDNAPGDKRSFPAAAARYFVDCGVARFIAEDVPADSGPVVERAVKRVGKA